MDFIDGAAAVSATVPSYCLCILTFAQQTANLTGINSAGNAYMAVDTTPVVSGARKSVRMTTDFSYTQGIVVLDAAHMPTGCGTWPAFWSNGPNWPSGGEIDIVEGVNTYTNDQVTLHTSPGCALPSTNADTLGISGTLVSTQDCAAADTQNAGCGVRSEETNSYGAGFNAMGGGVYASELRSPSSVRDVLTLCSAMGRQWHHCPFLCSQLYSSRHHRRHAKPGCMGHTYCKLPVNFVQHDGVLS